MRIKFRLMSVLCLSLSVSCLGDDGRSIAQFRVQVRSDNGAAITAAVVGASTFRRHVPGEGFGRDEYESARVAVDQGGIADFSIPSLTGDVSYGARPLTGFYDSASVRIFFTNAVAGKWQPLGKVMILELRAIVAPIPLYARKVSSRKKAIPVFGKPVGFDLLRSDWVAPHGTGEVSDLVFNLEVRLGGMTSNGYQVHDSVFTVSFSNEGDGIQPVYAFPRKGSVLRLPRLAPEQGYASNLVRRAHRHNDGGYVERREDQNYFFRVRAKKDEKGGLTNALYGKIHGEIEFEHTGVIRFTYYLNPTPNDRNLEFDPARNLFTDLSSLEEVRDP